MANAVTGDTTPNYFKEILQFLYPRFGNGEHYAPQEIFSAIDFNSENEADINRIEAIVSIFKDKTVDVFHTSQKSLAHNDHPVAYRLSICGFEFCQRHKEYFGL